MSEREPFWNLEPLERNLSAAPSPIRDVALGEGQQFTIPPATSVEIFPGAEAVRITTEDGRVEGYRLLPPTVREETVVFENKAGTFFATVAANAEVTVFNAPSRPRASSEPIPSPTPVVEAPARASEQKDKQRTTTVSGTLAGAPQFRQSRNGKSIAQFVLNIEQEDGSVAPKTVMAFNERAERLRGKFKPGETVEVRGYTHAKLVKSKDGKEIEEEQIYLVYAKSG